MTDDHGRVDFYDYDLPENLIASHPAERRESSRLLVCDPVACAFEETSFESIVDHLTEKDLLVFNNVRVIRARVYAKKPTGGAVELFVLESLVDWEHAPGKLRCMTRSSKPVRPGELSVFGEQIALGVSDISPGMATIELPEPYSGKAFLEAFGQMPLPPYIVRRREAMGEPKEVASDTLRYQTVFADRPGAVAAPTAGLHFSEALIERLKEKGVGIDFITLFVGPGTFKPVTADTLDEHEMHSERYIIEPGLGEKIAQTRGQGGRVIACGTTTARTLEAEARGSNFEPGERSTDIFIRPGFEWRVCDGLITNFHLPRSTLLALVFSFGGSDFLKSVYHEAIERELRFYSYGDAMFLVNRA